MASASSICLVANSSPASADTFFQWYHAAVAEGGVYSLTSATQETSLNQVAPEEWEAALRVVSSQKVAIFVVAYNAESHIRATLNRIPAELIPHLASIYVIDDKSTDRTTDVAQRSREAIPNLQIFSTPYNQGYGGNQKLGYQYAIQEGYDVVVLLHGDGQYAPEVLPRILAPFESAETAAVFGSRMMRRGAARKGGMPLYKYIGNRILTRIENRLLGTDLSEFHSGYRAYRPRDLAEIPFQYNTSDFHFDNEIIIQLLGKKKNIVEVPIPTYYGDEISHVNGLAYAFNCLSTVLRWRANQVYLVYHPKFNLDAENPYVYKEAPNSLHQHVVTKEWPSGSRILELGAGHGEVGLAIHEQGDVEVVALDLEKPGREFPYPFLEADLNGGFSDGLISSMGGPADVVVALDVIEHLSRPEASLREIKKTLAPGGLLVASTGNIAFILQRSMLGLGQFNYGKKGILDLTHQRLFSIRSFCRTLEGEGFKVESVRGFGPPIRDMVGDTFLLRALDRVGAFLGRVWPKLFGYQFLVEARRLDDIEDILTSTLESETSRNPTVKETV